MLTIFVSILNINDAAIVLTIIIIMHAIIINIKLEIGVGMLNLF